MSAPHKTTASRKTTESEKARTPAAAWTQWLTAAFGVLVFVVIAVDVGATFAPRIASLVRSPTLEEHAAKSSGKVASKLVGGHGTPPAALVEFDGCSIGVEFAEAIARWRSPLNGRPAERLAFRSCYASAEAWAILAQEVPVVEISWLGNTAPYSSWPANTGFPQLKRLRFENAGFDRPAAVSVNEIRSLEKLELIGATFSRGFAPLCQGFPVRELRVEACSMRPTELAALEHVVGLQTLTLLRWEGPPVALDFLARLPELRELTLDSSWLAEEHFAVLARCPKLTALELRGPHWPPVWEQSGETLPTVERLVIEVDFPGESPQPGVVRLCPALQSLSINGQATKFERAASE